MALDPGLGYKITATIAEVEGKCTAGHKVGDSFDISCHNPAGLCGFFYHRIFPTCRLSSSAEICLGGKEIPFSSNVQIAATLLQLSWNGPEIEFAKRW